MAVFEADRITLTGVVPSEAAADRVVAFALGYRLSPAPVADNLTIDANAPVSAGVRVVEHDSVNFVDDTDVITPEHARQLDRVVVMMTAMPDATVHVVGNTDQRGGETRNSLVSRRRAEAVVAYLVSRGIDGSRLTTQAAGESNPLSNEPTEAAHALNRRTEFVWYGLLGQ